MSKLISCDLMGGLGNQLFQSAHALAQGWKYNRDVVFLPKSYTPGQGRDAGNYVDNVFRNLTFVNTLDYFDTVRETSFGYNKVTPTIGNTKFYGYFQSTKNWYGYEDKIRDTFQPTEEFVESMKSKYPQLNENNTLSLHVRRSEYLQYPHIHPTITKEYIEEALEIIGDYSTVFVFSDDHNWVKENLNFPSVVFVNENSDYDELWLMSLCKNHIISNSTFSWWGVFLNKNLNKKIVAPSVWFGPSGPKDYQDIYESYWNVVDVDYVEGSLTPNKN